MKYPKKIKQIMTEAPMAFSILTLMDYNNGNADANELYRRWQRHKKITPKTMSNTVKCDDCCWVGNESELVADYYDNYNMSNPVEGCCPKCGSENIDGLITKPKQED